jgi:3D (Asp-Asp-Asp) domain-containing protein
VPGTARPVDACPFALARGERLRRRRPAATFQGLRPAARALKEWNRQNFAGGETMTDWDNAVVIDPKLLQGLKDENAKLRGAGHRQKIALGFFMASCMVTSFALYWTSSTLTSMSHEAGECRKTAQRSNAALGALAKSHENILTATEQAPSVGTKSWGRRFTITKYLPRSPAYGKFNDGLTSTLWKADPKARIVAVDPKLIPYGSWVWIEGLGWYRAQDCGSAIKGFRLDLLTETQREAMTFGKQDRFAIVVPPANAA